MRNYVFLLTSRERRGYLFSSLLFSTVFLKTILKSIIYSGFFFLTFCRAEDDAVWSHGSVYNIRYPEDGIDEFYHMHTLILQARFWLHVFVLSILEAFPFIILHDSSSKGWGRRPPSLPLPSLSHTHTAAPRGRLGLSNTSQLCVLTQATF